MDELLTPNAEQNNLDKDLFSKNIWGIGSNDVGYTPSSLLLPKVTSLPIKKVKRGTATDAYRFNARAKTAIATTLKEMDLFAYAEGERLLKCGSEFITTMSSKCGKPYAQYPTFRCNLAYCPDCNVRRR